MSEFSAADVKRGRELFVEELHRRGAVDVAMRVAAEMDHSSVVVAALWAVTRALAERCGS